MGYSWQFALTAVLIEGILFVLLCVSNLRHVIFDMVPVSLKYAIAAGIGFFIAMIGMKNSGLLATGTIFNHINTLTSPSSLLFLLGLVLTGAFAIMRFRGGLFAQHRYRHVGGHPFRRDDIARQAVLTTRLTSPAVLPVLMERLALA